MARRAFELRRSSGSPQIALEMHLVVETQNRAIRGARSARGEFGMAILERPDRLSDGQRACARGQLAVTLFAEVIVHRCELDGSAVIDVTRRARRREGLIRFVRRCIVAGDTCHVGHMRAKRWRSCGWCHVTPFTAPAEYLMGERERPAAVSAARAGGRQ